jgi:adenine deaminase
MPADLTDSALRHRAVTAARGEAPFDLLLTGGRVIDVATGLVSERDVGVVGPLIASLHAPGTRADAKRQIALGGALLAPGLIDAHMHVESSMVTPRGYAEVVVPQGTTAIVWDPHEVGNVKGLDGVAWALAAARDLPLEVIALAPSCVPSAPGLEVAGAAFDGPEMAEMLSWPGIAGVAEVMDMRGVLEGHDRMRAIVGAGLDSGKLVCGHGRGLSGADLHAYASAGVTSDHEIVSAEDLLAKLAAGLTIELRGSHDHLLPDCVAALNRLPMIPQTLTLCTDDVFPDDLVAKGGMIDLLRRLVRYGLDPVQAIRCATLNAAQRLKREDIGRVAPGRRATLIALSDLAEMKVRHVVVDGVEVARDGRLLSALRPDPVPAPTGAMKLAPLAAEEFALRVPGVVDGVARLSVIEGARFTKWAEVSARVSGGRVILPEGHAVMAAVHRHGRADATPKLAVLGDWGRFRGAFATTVAHDSHNLLVFGEDPVDMAAAANALIVAGGGMAVARGGEVIALLRLPVCGLVSEAPGPEVAAAFAAVRAAADTICEWNPPYRIFKAFVGSSLACNPGPHLTDVGLTDGGTGEIRSLVLETRAA